MRILRSADHRRMKWKNGGGETREIVISPRDASIAQFGWRISIATVTENGEFSQFDGVDRTTGILSGLGIELCFASGESAAITNASPPYAFDAGEKVHSRLLEGPVTDLNVMTRRSRFSHYVSRVKFTDQHTIRSCNGYTIAIATTPCEIRSGLICFEPLDALLLEPREAAVSLHAEGSASLFQVEIYQRDVNRGRTFRPGIRE